MTAPDRRVPVAVMLLVAAGAVTGCASEGSSNPGGVSGVPTSLSYDTSTLSAVTSVVSGVDTTLDACALLDLPTSTVAELTGVTLADEPPHNPDELRSMCTYGGPDPAAPTSVSPDVGDPTHDAAITPSTVSAGVVSPAGSARDALAGQPAQLAALYRCSELSGATEGLTVGAPAPGAPAPVDPPFEGPYVDCVATPTGGGTEVHLLTVDGTRMWHLASIQPSVRRTPETEAAALKGLHSLAARIGG